METQESNAMWGGRFEDKPDEFTQQFGASLPVDVRMWEVDIAGSKAHARMLGRQGIIAEADADLIIEGLEGIADDIAAGKIAFDMDDEDIHMAVERELTARIGEAGGRLHTARSRNDQVATDARLYTKELCVALCSGILELRGALIDVADANMDVIMPGYTHMQKAQPILFSHHMLAYQWMLTRDFLRVVAAFDAADALPLGSAALAGTTYPLDRDFVAEELGFAGITENSLDAVSDRDFLLDLDYACAVCMMHLSRLCEELIIWSTNEFRFITMSDAYSTGSSIMPQKKNPDFAELVRGKTGRVVGDLVALLVTMKSLPLAYNKDMQEDKEGAFDAADTLYDCLRCVTGMVSTMRVNADVMRAGAEGGFTAATDLADYLVGKGMPFREAHEVVGKLVLWCEKQGKTLQQLSAAELSEANALFDDDAVDAVKIENVVARRTTAGGTAPVRVAEQLDAAKESLKVDIVLLDSLGM